MVPGAIRRQEPELRRLSQAKRPSYHLDIPINCDVVVVDDEVPIAQMITDVLTDEGYSVAMVHDGASALLAIMYGKPRLVVLDIAMPVMTGDEVLRTVRRSGITETPIIVMSAGIALERYLAQGANEVLAKPFDVDRLVELVRQYLAT